MALAGITAVGEFHYLHHGPAARPYADPNAMGHALLAGRRRGRASGSPCSTPATCTAASATTARRACSGASATATPRRGPTRVDALATPTATMRRRRGDPLRPRRRPGRALAIVAAWAAARGAPLHAHVSEQPAENEAVPRPRTARTPTALLADAGALGRALHRRPRHPPDRRRHRRCSAAPAATCCLCPTTERDLADGIGPAGRLRRRRRRGCALGTDSHAVIDLLRGGARGRARRAARDRRTRRPHAPPTCCAAATGGGHACLGWPDAGRSSRGRAGRPGRPSASTPCASPARTADRARRLAVFAATARRRAPTSSSAARSIVARRPSRRRSTSPRELRQAIERCGAR